MEYIFKNLPTIYFPILWFETSFQVTDVIAGALRLLINIPTIMRIASIFGIMAGMVGIYLIYRQVSKKVSSESRVEKPKLSQTGKFSWLQRIPVPKKLSV